MKPLLVIALLGFFYLGGTASESLEGKDGRSSDLLANLKQPLDILVRSKNAAAEKGTRNIDRKKKRNKNKNKKGLNKKSSKKFNDKGKQQKKNLTKTRRNRKKKKSRKLKKKGKPVIKINGKLDTSRERKKAKKSKNKKIRAKKKNKNAKEKKIIPKRNKIIEMKKTNKKKFKKTISKKKTRGKKKKKKAKKTSKKKPSSQERNTERQSLKDYGAFGFEYPELIDWTLPEYRCPDCEDTLIIYDPWFAPPPQLHIPVFCTSNLSKFDEVQDMINFGPNITFIFIPGHINCTDVNRAQQINTKSFSVQMTSNNSETAISRGSDYYDCGSQIIQNEDDFQCGEAVEEYGAVEENHHCFWHIYAYQHWRRQIRFTEWNLPPCADGSTQGECCKQGPHVEISKTGYTKKLEAYCGSDPPPFEDSNFDTGRPRWLVVYKNEETPLGKSPYKVKFQAPSIGYRRTASYDQHYYGKKPLCGLRKAKRPAEDPLLQETDDSSRKREKRENHRRKVKYGRKTLKRKGQEKRSKKKKNQEKNNKVKKGKKKSDRKNMKKTKNKSNTIEKANNMNKDKKKGGNKRKKSMNKKKKMRRKSKGKNIHRKKKTNRKLKGKNKQRRKKTSNKSKKKNNLKSTAQKTEGRQTGPGPEDRFKSIWPWIVSVVYDNTYVCTGYSISQSIVIVVTKCFHWLADVKGSDSSTIEELNTQIDKIYVIGQDEQEIGEESGYWEEKRFVKEIRIHPDCDPVSRPQFCVMSVILSDSFNMSLPFRPRAVCLTCKLRSFEDKMLRVTPLLAGYGLSAPRANQRSATYRADESLQAFQSDSCVQRPDTTAETYCLKSLGEEKQCDTTRREFGGKSVLGHRDYGALLLNRFGRKGYKITFQVVGLLWDFSCEEKGPAEYIPTWPSLTWMMNLILEVDKGPPVKLVRKSEWTREVYPYGYYENGGLL